MLAEDMKDKISKEGATEVRKCELTAAGLTYSPP